jgi:DNA-binding transcriptional MerR regulator
MTVDELAQRAGTSTRNVRAFQTAGLLPRPDLVGRTGWYGEDHLARLEAILRLQARGFSLAGIGELFRAWEQGRSLEELVGLPPRRRRRRAAVPDDDPFAWADGLPRRAHLVLVPGTMFDQAANA